MRIVHQAEIDGWDITATKNYLEKGTNRYQNRWDPYQNRKGTGRREKEQRRYVCVSIENGTNQYQKGGTHTKIGMQQRREKEQVLFHHVKTDVVLDQISLIWSISEIGEEIKDMVLLTLAH